MKLSAKGRYALVALTYMAQLQPSGPATFGCEAVTLIKISERLDISKIYLEQTFSLLKRAGLVSAVKGAQGGYFLSREPERISALDVLSATESPLFEKTEHTTAKSAPDIDSALRKTVFSPLDATIASTLTAVTLQTLVAQAEQERSGTGYMFFI